MALLLNRKYGSRLECLYYILQSRYEKFGMNTPFSLRDFKFSEADEKNVHNYCKLLEPCVGINCCKFLNNPLDSSKCYATQSITGDSTKSKAVSDVGGSLEALGFIVRIGKGEYKISELGKCWAQTEFVSAAWTDIAREAVLSYGPLVGFLSKLRDLNDEFSYSGIYLGYPKTEEKVEYIGDDGIARIINLSTDSRRDSNTRTVSKIIGWCVTTGLLIPKTTDGVNSSETLPQLKYRDFINKEELTVRTFKKSEITKKLFDNKFTVNNPLSFSRLHKNVGSMRENGEKDLRKATMRNNPKILNRRYVFVKVLNHCSINNIALNFERLIETMKIYEDCFCSPGNNIRDIMASEAEIADIVGIPFIDNDDGFLVPLTELNEQVLDEGVTTKARELARLIIKDMFE